MVKKTIYVKTARGISEGANLSGDLRQLLGLIDGKTQSDELAKRAPPSLRKNWDGLIGELVAGRFIDGSNTSDEVGGADDPSDKQKTEQSARAQAELKAFFATAKIKAEAEAKAAREEAKARELEKAAQAKAESERKAKQQAVPLAQADTVLNTTDLRAKQLAEKVVRDRIELEKAVAIAKLRTNADIQAKAEAKTRQEIEKMSRAKAALEVKSQQKEKVGGKAESQIAATLAAKWKAEEAARLRAELGTAKVKQQAEVKAKQNADAEIAGQQKTLSREQVDADVLAAGFVSRDEFGDASFRQQHARAGSLDESEVQRLLDLEKENGNLKKLLAEAYLEIELLKIASGVKR
jgi:hypothetical protein